MAMVDVLHQQPHGEYLPNKIQDGHIQETEEEEPEAAEVESEQAIPFHEG